MVNCTKCKRDQEDVSVFKFPFGDQLQLAIWESYVGVGFKADSGSRLCHHEFDKDQFKCFSLKNGSTKRVLVRGAIPKGFVLCKLDDFGEYNPSVMDLNLDQQQNEGTLPETVDVPDNVELDVDEQDHQIFDPTPLQSQNRTGEQLGHALVEDLPGEEDMETSTLVDAPIDEESKFRQSLCLEGKSQEDMIKLLYDKLWTSHQQMEALKIGLGKFLNQDQLLRVLGPGQSSQPWSAPTVATCFQIWAKVGTSGYEYLREVKHWPLVSLRTLQERAAQVPFLPGIQHPFIKVMGKKIAGDEIGQLVCLSADEMAVRPRVEIDPSTKSFIGLECMQLAKQKPNDLVEEWPAATHLQVFIFRGAAWHFKLLGDYNFTGDSVDPIKQWKYSSKLIKVAKEEGGMTVITYAMDYGSNNKAMMSHLGIKADREDIVCTVPHPADSSKVLIITTDAPHGLKGMKRFALTYQLLLPEFYCKKHQLETNVVMLLDHLKQLLEIQKGCDVVMVMNLTQEVLHPKNWESMRVSDALAVFNTKVSSALRTCVKNGWMGKEALATAQFVETMSEWYSIMSARTTNKALWKDDKFDGTSNRLDFLENEFIPLIQKITILDGPSSIFQAQINVLICTKAALTVYDLYVKRGPLKFFLPSRMTTEVAENTFSLVRVGTGDAHPSPLQAKNKLKKVTLSQALAAPKAQHKMKS